MNLVLGTRGSALALAQTALTLEALRNARPDGTCAVREIKTTGDQRPDLSLTHLAPDGHGYQVDGSATGKVDPGLFTRELEVELLAGSISVAVHSLKDLPTTMPPGLVLAAVLPRADTADVLIWKGAPEGSNDGALPPLPEDATVATSSLRRQRQLRWHRPDLRVCEVRGNVGTRLQKLHDHDGWTGLILARAGLERLGYAEQIRAGYIETANGVRFAATVLGPAVMLPAVGQGAIGLQARADDVETLRRLAAVNHAPTWSAVTAERALLSRLGGGCQLPLGVVTERIEERGQLRLQAVLFGLDGDDAPPRFGEGYGPWDDPAQAAERCARELGF